MVHRWSTHTDTLEVLLQVTFTATELHQLLAPREHPRSKGLVRHVVQCVNTDDDLARTVDAQLSRRLGAATHSAIEPLCRDLRIARQERRADRVARVLWLSARRPGLAWRRMEQRALHALLDMALSTLAETMKTSSNRLPLC